MTRRGCFITITLLFVLAVVALVAVLLFFTSEPNSIRVRLDADTRQIAVGESLALQVTIENVSLDPVTLDSVAFDRDLLDGVNLVQTLVGDAPTTLPVEEQDYSVAGAWWQYELDQDIAPGDALDVTFVFEGVAPGAYAGDVMAWVDVSPLGVTLPQARREPFDYSVQ